jgi:predicted nucleic acid-binding protein
MIVVDASAIIHALEATHPNRDLIHRMIGTSLHAPNLLDAEFLHGIRGLLQGRKITLDRANDARREFYLMHVIRYPLARIAERVWSLRDNLTAYDASYVALAEALECPLVTTDGKLAKAVGHFAAVEVYTTR